MAIGKWNPFGQTQSSSPAPPVVAARAPVISAADAKQFGLENVPFHSYANSVLQALYFCGPFRELLVQYPDPSAPDVPPLPSPSARAPTSIPSSPALVPRRRPERKASVSESSPLQSSAPSASLLGPPPAIPSQPPTLLSALRSLFVHISRHPAERGSVAPRAFIDKLKELNELFRGSMHQDAHEFLNFLLNKIVEEMEDDRRLGYRGLADANGNGNGHAHAHVNGGSASAEDMSASIATMSSIAAGVASASVSTTQPTAMQATIVHRLFEGVLTSETRCLTCETVSSRDESFLDLSIDIEQNSSVTACLRQFSASEMLCQKNKFFCDSCCDLQEAEKRMKIKKLPNILALHLKRFKYQEDVGKYIKLAYRVAFPFQLRLFNTVDDAENPDRLYELFAIVVHIGNGPHHGHYVTIIKARGTWLLFDDDSVDTIKESDIPKYYGESTNGSAYVLYYQAVDLDMAALGLRPREATPSAADIGSSPTAKPADVIATTTTDSSERDPCSPALPPGLSEEPDSSDKSDSPLLSTPASQPIPLLPNRPPKSPSPTPQSNGSAGSSQTQPLAESPAPSSTLGGLLNTLRHTSSMRARGENRRSVLDSSVPPVPSLPSPSKAKASHRPGTAQSAVSVAGGPHDAPPEPASPSGPAKEKTPEKKTSMWLRMKSSRLEASFSGTSSASSAAPREEVAWPRSQTVKGSAGAGRRASHVDVPSAFAASPPLAAAMSVPSSPVQPRLVHPEHKKSTPELTPKGKSGMTSIGRASSALARLPKRPSTAGATPVGSSSSWSRPNSSVVPPLPTLPGSPTLGQAAADEAAERATPHSDAPPSSASTSRVDDFGMRGPLVPQRPSTAIPMPGAVGMSASYSTSSAASSNVADRTVLSGGTKKRATRKLSFTAPMLGFGRKDRQKERETPPSAFPLSQ
ncbi:hypothetical protein IEO21_01233 [Rhodonia placenta]|uniref:ubiquitinyl hydrolase 1 n=1 Tax=Rhodonia placenta TaxID=104341 RepID=A0A8H7PA47_9APHY|nr:hypothetical protein IEO21_01233 [Postia placenta]